MISSLLWILQGFFNLMSPYLWKTKPQLSTVHVYITQLITCYILYGQEFNNLIISFSTSIRLLEYLHVRIWWWTIQNSWLLPAGIWGKQTEEEKVPLTWVLYSRAQGQERWFLQCRRVQSHLGPGRQLQLMICQLWESWHSEVCDLTS